MINLQISLLRIAGRSAVAVAVLAFSATTAFAAGKAPSSAASTAQTQKHQSSGNTSVSAELQKLFQKSGQQMPSMKTADLPYATTPQMDRIRKRDAKPAADPLPRKGFVSRFFGRFRRQKREDEIAETEPPPIVLNDAPVQNRRHRKGSRVTRPVSSQRPAEASDQAQSMSQSVQVPVPATKTRPMASPASQSMKPVVGRPKVARMPMVSHDSFVNPFEDAASFSEGGTFLDLDTFEEIPTVADDVSFPEAEPAAEEEVEPSSVEPKNNPFSGKRIDASGDFVNPFEGSSVDENEATDLHEVDSAARMVPSTATVDSLGSVEDDLQSNPFATEYFQSTEIEEPKITVSVNKWQTPETSNDDSVSVEPRMKSTARDRRLAPIDRIPVKRTQVERWRRSNDSDKLTLDEEESSSEAIQGKSAAQTLTMSPQDTRLQKIQARRHLSGFMGFCPVELRESQDLVDAVDTHQARFGLNTYRFSSAEARDRFKANPTGYAPSAGGADVVVLVNAGEQHAGSLEFATWYRDRLYMFSSIETMGLFRADPASFADQY